MSDQKYYVPDLADIHEGYEFEGHAPSSNSFNKMVFRISNDWMPATTFKSLLEQGWVRTPFLTREDIEREGFKCMEESSAQIDAVCESIGIDITVKYKILQNSSLIRRIKHYPYKHKVEYEGVKLACPSINEFRKIMKMVGIVKPEVVKG